MLGRALRHYKARFIDRVISSYFAGRGDEGRSAHSIPTVQLPSLTAQLSVFAASLQNTGKNAEPHFIRLGCELQSLHSDAVALTQQTIKAIQLIGEGTDENLLTGIGDLVKESLFNLTTCKAEVSTNLSHVNRVVRHLGELYDMCAVVEKIALFLKVVGLSIGIESSRSSEIMEMFSSLAREIQQLSDKVARIAGAVRKDSESARVGQFAAHSEIFEGLRRLCELTDEAEKTVQKAALEIEHLMEVSVRALEQAGEHSRRISGQVGEIVVKIQLHDSMSQRIEHIVKALHDVEDLCAEGTAEGASGTESENLSTAHSLLSFQTAQLEQVITEVSAAYEKSKQSFEEIHNTIDRTAHSVTGLSFQACSGIRSEEADSLPEEGALNPFAALKEAVDRLDRLMEQGRNLFEQTRSTAAQTFDTSVRLAGNIELVREINVEIHLKALNAIVKASHLQGQGRTLEVLAQEMKRASDQSSAFASRVEDILKQIDTSAQALHSGTESSGVYVVTAEAGMSPGVGVQNISRAYLQFRKESSEVSRQASSLKNAVSQTISDLDFLPALAMELADHLRRLEEIKQVLSPWAIQGSKTSLSDPDNLSERYTMQGERDVHEQVLDQMGEPVRTLEKGLREESNEEEREVIRNEPVLPPAEANREAQDEEKENLGDNVELF